MLKKITLLLSLLFSVLSFSQTSKIHMEIQGIENTKGIVSLALYDSAKDFTKVELKTTKLKPSKGKIFATFDNLSAGTYGVAVLHDENQNEKMDFNLLGMPKEAFGFSNNPKVILTAPDFDDVSFRLKSGETKKLKIKLK